MVVAGGGAEVQKPKVNKWSFFGLFLLENEQQRGKHASRSLCQVCKYVYVHLCASAFITGYVCVHEAANHRLIGAIRELAERYGIAAPDGQPEVVSQHTLCIHT